MINPNGVAVYDNTDEADPLHKNLDIESLGNLPFGIIDDGIEIRPATEDEFRATMSRVLGIPLDELEILFTDGKYCGQSAGYPYCRGIFSGASPFCKAYNKNGLKGCACFGI
jgi:hypothetical protein